MKESLTSRFLRGQRALTDFIDPESGKVLVKRGRRITVGAIRKMEQAGIEYVQLESEEPVG